MTDFYGVSADFAKEYSPQIAENSKFLVANTDDPIYSGYEAASGYGKFVSLAYMVNEVSAVDFSQTYSPRIAENGKFVHLDLDPSLGWPASNYPKYGVLTYIVNPNWLTNTGGSLSGDLDMLGNNILNAGVLSGTSDQWNSAYTTVLASSGSWGGGSSVSFGSHTQIPFTNNSTDDFEYGGFTFDGITLVVPTISAMGGTIYLDPDFPLMFDFNGAQSKLYFDTAYLDLVIDPDPNATGNYKLRLKSGEVVVDKTLSFDTQYDHGNVSGSTTIEWTQVNKQTLRLTGTSTLSFNAPAGVTNLLLKVVQDGTGSHTITWPASVKWPSGAAPTLSTAPSAIDIVTFYYDETNYFGVGSLDFQ